MEGKGHPRGTIPVFPFRLSEAPAAVKRYQDGYPGPGLRREGKEVVPAKAIAMTSNRLEMPSIAEGFDALYFVANDGEEMTISEWREDE